jgi:hypothetical protein
MISEENDSYNGDTCKNCDAILPFGVRKVLVYRHSMFSLWDELG